MVSTRWYQADLYIDITDIDIKRELTVGDNMNIYKYCITFFRSIFYQHFLTRMHSSSMRTVFCSGLLGGGLSRRGCLPGGGGLPDTLPPANRITNKCKNIAFLKLRCGL